MPHPRLLAIAALLTTAACGGTSSRPASTQPLGSVAAHPDGSGTYYTVDSHRGGNASSMKLLYAAWGRLVDLYDRDPLTSSETLRFRELVVGRDIASDGVTFELRDNAVTGVQELVCLHAFDSPQWNAAFARLETHLQPVQENSSGVVTMVARNSTLVLAFDDLLDAESVDVDNLRVLTGLPPTQPFTPRVLLDRNHGDAVDRDGDGTAEFYSTRVLVDFSISEFERQRAQLPVAVNVVGLPEASAHGQPNVELRIPTRVDLSAGQFDVLRNLSQHAVSFVDNGAVDNSVPTLDVVRDFRSGGGRLTPADPDNGYLPDATPPSVIGGQDVQVTRVAALGSSGTNFEIDLAFATAACLLVPEQGDVLELATGILAQVSADVGPPPVGAATFSAVRVRRIGGAASSFVPSAGRLLAPFEPTEGDDPACFVQFVPAAGTPPAADVQPGASVIVRFSEAMEPAAFEALRNFGVQRTAGAVADGLQQRVVGRVRRVSDLSEVRFEPVLPLTHAAGTSERYVFELDGAVTDLGGNALTNALPAVAFKLAAQAPATDTMGVALDFSALDQDADMGHEFRGQFLLDPFGESLRPRLPTRFSAVADATQKTFGIRIPLPAGISDPISPFGSHAQHVWRYPDLGLDLLDESTHNIDVEGLSWAPQNGQVAFDRFDQFEIRLGHARKQPDELPDATGLAAMYPNSGLGTSYAGNYLDAPAVVHERALGYVLDPLDAFLSANGTTLLPWPLNRDRPDGVARYFTWRDTTETGVGGALGWGADLAIMGLIDFGAPQPPVYPTGSVPSIGLPLLMEFRCYADQQAIGSNRVSASTIAFPKPAFRAYSTGGVDAVQQLHLVDPDNDPVAVGGFDPNSSPPGQGLPPTDNLSIPGQVDFVVRVSVVHSMWFDSGATSGFADWVAPVVEPRPSEQPSGTTVTLAFRGAAAVVDSAAGSGAARDARNLDPYGEVTNGSVNIVFFNNDSTWKNDIDELDGARFVQVRAMLVSNAESGQQPRLAGLGLGATR